VNSLKLTILLCICLKLASAQTDSLKETSLPEFSVVGSKFEQQKKDELHQISQISKLEISNQHTPNTANLLEKTGSAYVQYSQNGGGSPVLRGFEGNKILLILDGVRVNNAIFRGGHLQNILRIDQNALSAVEILYGPGTVMYGSDALGGVVYLRSTEPSFDKDKLEGFFRYGSNNREKTFNLNYNKAFKKLAFYSNITVTDLEHIRLGKKFKSGYEGFGLVPTFVGPKDSIIRNNNPYAVPFSAYSQYNFLQKVKYNGQKLSHNLNLQYTVSSEVNRNDRLSERNSNGLPVFAQWNYGPEKYFFSLYSFQTKIRKKAFDVLSFSSSAQNFKESRINRTYKSSRQKNQLENVWAYTQNIDAKKTFKNSSLNYGAEFVLNKIYSKAFFKDINNELLSLAETRYPNGGSSTRSLAAYFNANQKIKENLMFNAGFRYSNNYLNARLIQNEIFKYPFTDITQKNSSVSYSAGFKYIITKERSVNILVSRAFRSPNIDDLTKIYESTNRRLVVPNSDIKTEFVHNLEVNTLQKIGKLTLEAAIYRSFYENIIVIDSFKYENQSKLLFNNIVYDVFASQNKEKASITGAQASLIFDLNNVLRFSSSLSFNRGRYKNGENLDHIPPLFGKTQVLLNLKKWNFDFNLRYNGAKKLNYYAINGEDNVQFASPDGSLAWLSTNFFVDYKLNENWVLQGAVDNIFDINYRTFSSGISAPGRNMLGSIRFKF
jgi:hemoglobin/transferrin/lactoferrin receptor protein